MAMHEALEAELAAFKGTPAVLTFQSGFSANTGVIPTVTGETDLIVSDELNHASIIDGMRLSKAPRKVYPHADVEALHAILGEAREQRPGRLGRPPSAHPRRDRRGVQHGRRHRATPRDRRGGRGVRGGRHGRRRPCLGGPRAQRPRHRRPLRPPRPRRHPGRDAVEGGRLARRLRGGQPGLARDPHPAVPAVPLLDLASAGGRGRLPGGDPGHGGGARAPGTALGEHAPVQGRAHAPGLRHRAARRRRSRRS